MANPFDRLVVRMDEVTIKKMSKIITINGQDYTALPSEQPVDMGPVNSNQICLVIFSDTYQPRRNDCAVFEGKEFIVTRNDRFNGKSRIYLE